MNYYEILGLQRNANSQEIKNAYKKLALKYHPDRNPKGAEHFKLVSESYQVLIDPELRKKYNENQNFHVNYKNPKDIWKSFFPGNISDEVFDALVKSILNQITEELSFETLYQLLVNKLSETKKTKTQNLFIKVNYDVKDHFNYIFNKKVYVEMETNKKIKTFVYEIDTRKENYLFKENCLETINNGNFNININLNIIPQIDACYDLLDRHNLLYKLKISYDNYILGFYLNHDLFGNKIVVYFKEPVNSYLLYRIPNLGVPIDNKTRGDLYFKLVISQDKHLEYKPQTTCNIISAEPVDFF